MEQVLNTFVNIARAIYEIEYDEEIDGTRKIHISITMEDISEEG